MADKAVPFFNPSDLLSLGGDWIVQDHNIAAANQRAQGLAATGDEAASKLYDGKTSGSIAFECHAETGSLTLPNVGAVKGGYHIDSLQLVYNPAGWPKLTLNVHKHDDNSHAADSMNEFAPSPTFPAQFGVPRGLTIGAGAQSITDTACGIKSMTYNLACTHVDELDEAGDHLAGENRDGAETLAIEYTKNPAVIANTGAGWSQMSGGSTLSNTAAETASYSWEAHVVREA